MQQKLIYGLVSALFVSSAYSLPAQADETTDQLVKQLQELQETVKGLKQELQSVKSAPAATDKVAAHGDGESAEKTATIDDVNGLRTDLENFKYQYSREREYNTAQTSRPVNISGFVQIRAQTDSVANGANINAAGATTQNFNNNKRHSSFNNGAAAIQFSGLLFKDYEDGRNLSYNLRLAANPSTASGINPLGTNSTVNLQFANLAYQVRPTLNPEDSRLTVTVGQQLVPFGLDMATTDELKPTILNAQLQAQTPNIDIGALVRGEWDVNYDFGYSYRAPTLQYYAGVFNGAGLNNTDNNSPKNLFGRLVYTVPSDYNSWLRQLAFGVSAYKGKQNLALRTATALNAGTLLDDEADQKRLGFDVYYNHDPFGFTFEYLRSKDDRAYGTALATKNIREVEGVDKVFTAYYNIGQQFLYNFSALGTPSVATGRFDDWWPKSWQIFARYDKYDPDVDDVTKNQPAAFRQYEQKITTLGVNAFFAQTTKFQLNYIHYDRDQPNLEDDKQILAQFQYTF